MSNYSRKWDATVYQQYIREGRGQGSGAKYKPWITVRDFPSRGKVSYEKKSRTSILRVIAEKNNTKPYNLYRYLDRYWRFGKTKNAFVPQYSNCGGKGEGRIQYIKRSYQ